MVWTHPSVVTTWGGRVELYETLGVALVIGASSETCIPLESSGTQLSLGVIVPVSVVFLVWFPSVSASVPSQPVPPPPPPVMVPWRSKIWNTPVLLSCQAIAALADPAARLGISEAPARLVRRSGAV